MTKKAPGKHHLKGMTLKEPFDLFLDDEAAEAWLVDRCWPDNVTYAA